jgi:hypothetical protein
MARVVIMGVAGAGKTTVGNLAAELLGFPFMTPTISTPPPTAPRWPPANRSTRDLWIERVCRALEQHPDVVSRAARCGDGIANSSSASSADVLCDVPADDPARRLRTDTLTSSQPRPTERS